MIGVYADGVTVYNSRLDDFALLGLKVTTGLNKGGMAEIIMPPGHPAYNSFVNYRTVVTIYRGAELIFRGRALYPSDDFYKRRVITCEGERCFLRDAVMRPYLYQDSPAAIFAEVVGIYNAQVEEAKQFQVGAVTVIDANDYIRIESESAEQVADTIDKLVERCGGYIVFNTNAEGRRVINWYEATSYQNNQVIEFGENLLDFARTQASTDLATRIIPYGAKDEETGERVTIRSVNGDLDFIEDAAAVALRGVIARAVYWDDVTNPTNLLRKAQQYLATSKMIITTLELSAVDLSALDYSLDTFQVGDIVQVRSRPHNVDDRFLLQERTYDLLDPSQDKVVLGKDRATLTGADVAGDRDTMSQLHRTENIIKADYQLGIAKAVKEAKTTLTSLIEQTSTNILLQVSETYATSEEVQNHVDATLTRLSELSSKIEQTASNILLQVSETYATSEEVQNHVDATLLQLSELSSTIEQTSASIMAQVSETYATNDQVRNQISTTLTQLSDSFNFEFDNLRAVVADNDTATKEQFETIHKYIRFVDGNILLGEDGNDLTLRIENDRISFLDGGAEVAYFSNKQLYVLDGHFLNSLRVGKFAWLPRENGNLSLVKVGE